MSAQRSAGAKAPRRIAFYGKGGVGKSTVAAHVSAHLARRGLRVLHVGCDPKRDSTLRLLEPPARPRPVLETVRQRLDDPPLEELVTVGRHGIHCCESGGPPPGLGCGGRGVARTVELLVDTGALAPGRYDVVVFDVLGDVVCGGFGAPLREGVGELVVIVASEEPMALLAANNIARAVLTYAENGIALAGLVANLRAPDTSVDWLERFAGRLSTRVLATVPRDAALMAAERARSTVFEHAPASPSAAPLAALAESLLTCPAEALPLPTPLDDDEILAFLASP